MQNIVNLIMVSIRQLLLFLLMWTSISAGPTWQTLLDTEKSLIFNIQFDVQHEGDLAPITFLIGLPDKNLPELYVRALNKKALPFEIHGDINGIRWINQQKLRSLETATLEVNPVNSDGHYFESITIELTFPSASGSKVTADNIQRRLLKNRVYNWTTAQQWLQPQPQKQLHLAALPPGKWIRFAVHIDQMYSFTSADLTNLATELQQSDPRSFMLFTGSALGRDHSATVINNIQYSENPDNLVQVALFVAGEENGQLDDTDEFIFYGRGANGFDLRGSTIDHHQNIYFTENIYWLLIPDNTTLRGQRVTELSGPSSTALTLGYGIAYIHIENDIINPFQAGLTWTGASFGRGSSFTIVPNFFDVKPSILAEFELTIQGSSVDIENIPSPTHSIDIFLNSRNTKADSTIVFGGLGKQTKSFSVPGSELVNGTNLIYLDNNSTSNYSLPHFDYVTINYGRTLNVNNGAFEFFAPFHSNSVTFELTGTNAPSIWDITSVTKPKKMNIESTADTFTFSINLPPDTLARFILFHESDINPITSLELVAGHSFTQLRNQNTRVEHLIIGPEEFQSAAQPLVDHRDSSQFVSLDVIYNEFSGGNPDPTAIRRFLQWTQEEWSTPPPYCALLLGDADYDYRNISGQSAIKVPTIIIGSAYNYAFDDRLAAINGRIPDLALGRYPAKTVNDVKNFVEKIIAYETDPVYGIWRQKVTLVADDAARPEDGGRGGSVALGQTHTRNSESTAKWISPKVDVQKLYMLEFPEVNDGSSYGVIKPGATNALLDIINEGTAIINYIGHGSEHQWAQEKLLRQDRGDIDKISTEMKLPIWIAGTCSWGHFDFINKESFPEELIRRPMEAAAAIITTTRAIGESANAAYIKKIFKAIFPNYEITNDPLGVVLQSVKDGNSNGELFHLFGDPAMPLPIPTDTVKLISVTPDTMRSLDTGRVLGQQSLSLTAIGTGVIRLGDATREVTRQYNINSQTEQLSYTLPGPTLFQGRFTVAGPDFSVRLRIPKDISYAETPVQLNAYVHMQTEPQTDALGLLKNIYLTGGDPVADTQGPIISFETESRKLLRNNDHLLDEEKIYMRISDPLGINVTGEVGHEIMITDLHNNSAKNMSSRFIYDENSITTGVIHIPYENTTSSISLHIKAWDNANNPAEQNITLYILSDQSLQLNNVLNFPNPFVTSTQFAFELSNTAEVNIDIYTLGGRRIISLPPESLSSGYHFINWDGRDAYGERLANGAYLYRLQADDGQQKVSVINKLAKFQ